MGMVAGIIFSMGVLYVRIVRSLRRCFSTQMTQILQINADFNLRDNQKYNFKKICENFTLSDAEAPNLRRLPASSTLSTLIFLSLLVVNIFYLQSPILFVCTGIVFLFTCWIWFEFLINRKINQKVPFDISKLMWSSLFYAKKQTMLSFITLASGVFIVFSVGLNRQGFADTSQIQTATGGFSLWCETSVPVYHNMQTEEGRAKLGLSDLPKEAHVIQLLKYSADDASCLNLNKVVTPNVLGIAPQPSEGGILGKEFAAINRKSSLRGVGGLSKGEAIPALVDETVLKWNLGKKLGDTIVYLGEKGETVYVQLAGTLQNSIFQGYILIDKTLFSEIWSEISGSEIMLVSVPDTAVDATKALISQALNNYGVRVMTTGERLKMFYSVTDTYLTIFLTLGGLGLLLGIFSFIIVVRKNIISRMKEITLYRSLGFDEKRTLHLLYKENIIVPLYAILTGAVGSLLGVSMGFDNVNGWIWTMFVGFLVAFIFCVVFFVKNELQKYLKQRG
jgi:putative ABC transport system permease protein